MLRSSNIALDKVKSKSSATATDFNDENTVRSDYLESNECHP